MDCLLFVTLEPIATLLFTAIVTLCLLGSLKQLIFLPIDLITITIAKIAECFSSKSHGKIQETTGPALNIEQEQEIINNEDTALTETVYSISPQNNENPNFEIYNTQTSPTAKIFHQTI